MERQAITIRNFEPQDRVGVVTLIEEHGLTKGVYGFLNNIIEESDILVAEHEGNVIGTVVVEEDRDHKNASCIQYLVVDSQHRGKNIGRDLVNGAEDIMRGQNRALSVVYPLESKAEVIEFYEKLGYVHREPKLKKQL